MSIGAYAMGMLVVDAGWSLWAAMPVAAAIAVVAGLLVGLPSLRLLGLFRHRDYRVRGNRPSHIPERGLRGRQSGDHRLRSGVARTRRMAPASARVLRPRRHYTIAALHRRLDFIWDLSCRPAAARASPGAAYCERSREDEEAAAALGKNVLTYKLQSLAIRSGACRHRGVLPGVERDLPLPERVRSDLYLSRLRQTVLGGYASYGGVALAAICWWSVMEGLRFLHLPLSDGQQGSLRFVLIGLAPYYLACFAQRACSVARQRCSSVDDSRRIIRRCHSRGRWPRQAFRRLAGRRGRQLFRAPRLADGLDRTQRRGQDDAVRSCDGLLEAGSGTTPLRRPGDRRGAAPSHLHARPCVYLSANPRIRRHGRLDTTLASKGQPGELLRHSLAPARDSGRSETVVRERALAMLRHFDLENKSEDYAGRLSGGQRKLLELARALMTAPRMVLLDEPMAGVNRGARPAAPRRRRRQATGRRDLSVRRARHGHRHEPRGSCRGDG